MKMKTEYINIFICLCSFFLSICIFLFAVSGLSFQPNIILFISFLGFLFLTYHNLIISFIRKHRKLCLTILIFICFIARFLPLILNWQYCCMNDLSDTGVHYFGAQELAVTGTLEEKIINYEKMFPYLFPYTYILSLFTRITFNNINIAIVLSNVIFDCISILLIYKIIKTIKE